MKFVLPLVGFLLMALLLGIGLTLNPRELPSTLLNKNAPDFTLERLYAPGESVSPADLRGKRWLLNVWASWCAGCRVEHPVLNELAQKTDIILVGLNYKDEPANARRWLAERGNPYALIAKDIEGNAGIDWGVYGAPETFVIDENGIVIYKHIGPLDIKTLQQEILPLFANAPTS